MNRSLHRRHPRLTVAAVLFVAVVVLFFLYTVTPTYLSAIFHHP
jgi:hypothetical protein